MASNKAQDRRAAAAAALAEQRKRESRRRILTIGAVALAMIVIVGGAIAISLVVNHHQNSKKEAAVAALGTSEYGVVMGPASAPKHVVIYEDFLCPFCGQLEKDSHTQLADLAAQGKVRVEYRPFNLLGQNDGNSYSVRAAGAFSIVKERAGAAAAKKFHDLLYANQPEESGPFLSNDDLVKYAVQAGATEAQVRAAIDGNTGIDWVNAATKQAADAGIDSTPSIFLDGKLLQGGTAADLLGAVQ